MIIEIRPIIEKMKLKQQTRELKSSLYLHKTHKVPHLTLLYDFRPKIKPYDLARIIQKTARNYVNLGFRYDGWELRKGKSGYVFGFRIEPNNELKAFRWALYRNLKNYIIEGANANFNSNPPDKFWFHAAISYHMNESAANRVDNFLKNEDKPTLAKKTFIDKLFSTFTSSSYKNSIRPLVLDASVIRIPILGNNQRITYEYDVMLDKILDRRQALSFQYKKFSLARYRAKNSLELKESIHEKRPSIYAISDTHFDHENIIGLCSRPFGTLQEMNQFMLENWNSAVSKNDTVYFLGDLVYWDGHMPKRSSAIRFNNCAAMLNGNKIFVRGNHDSLEISDKTQYLNYKGVKFAFVHDPENAPKNFNGWLIHGDKHNNDIKNYPFINGDKKTINVSAELINYTPLNLDRLFALKIDSIKRMDALNSEPTLK